METEQYLTLKIIEDFESATTKKIRIVSIASIIFMITGLPALNYFTGETILFKIVAIAAIATMMISGISYNLSNKSKVTGMIELKESLIKWEKNGKIISIPLDNINKLGFKYRGYEGEPIRLRSLASMEGNDNYLTIYMEGGQHEFQVFLDNNMQVNILRRLFSHYEINGTKIMTNNFSYFS